MTLDEYRNSEDSNLFWRLQSGDIQNLLDEALEELEEKESLFELQHRRLEKAQRAWQKAHNQPDRYPDLGKLLDWLMQEAEIESEGAPITTLLARILKRCELKTGPVRVDFPNGIREATIGIGRDNMATIYLTDDDKAGLDALCAGNQDSKVDEGKNQ